MFPNPPSSYSRAQLINQQVQQIATGGLYSASNIAALAKVPTASGVGVGVGVVGGTEPGAAATSLGSLSFAPTSQTVATPGLLSATVGLQSQGQGSAVGGMLDYGRWKQVLCKFNVIDASKVCTCETLMDVLVCVPHHV